MRYETKWPEYAHRWDAMQIVSSHQHELDHAAATLLAGKDKLTAASEAVWAQQNQTRFSKIPWYMLGVILWRERDLSVPLFEAYLGNGQSIRHRTTIVPRGRGPFPTFEAGVVDAVKIDGLDRVLDWRLEKMLYYCEALNGAGYANRGVPSPYIWSFTNQYIKGKFDYDGHYNPSLVDPQPGCAALFSTLAKLDKTIEFVGED